MEGYVLHSYGPEKYLRHAVASALTIRRHDERRPIALYADDEQIALLRKTGLDGIFELLRILPAEHRSIVGFKHYLHRFSPFDKNLFVDGDMVWCKNPDPLWKQLSAFSYTATGVERADFFFGGPKGAGVIAHFIADRRRKTMRRFDVTYLPRIQAGMIYSGDTETTRQVCEEAASLLNRRAETHFGSRLHEGRNEESCEWSIALAMSRLDLPVFHWYQGQNTPQMDYVDGFVRHDRDFEKVSCLYNNDRFVHELRGIPNKMIRVLCIRFFSALPGKGDHMWITPYVLHFGWLRYKKTYSEFADLLWNRAVIKAKTETDPTPIPAHS